MARIVVGLELLGLISCSALLAHAQDAPAAAPPAPAPSPSTQPAPTPSAPPEPATAPKPSAQPAAPEAKTCVPSCRVGYTCVDAVCISACNPVCPAGETCTADARCVKRAAAASAPVHDKPAADQDTRAPWVKTYSGPARRDESYEPVAPVDQKKTGINYHDGFYFRFGVGVGYVYGEISARELAGDVTTTGISVPFEVALGGTPVPGIVIGVGSYPLYLPALNYSVSVAGSDVEGSADAGSFGALGPFVDFYPNPTQGVHLQAAPTFIVFSPGTSDGMPIELSGNGFGAMIGAGYELWVAEQWGGGWLVRLQAAKVTLEDEAGNEYDYVTIMPSVLFTITLH